MQKVISVPGKGVVGPFANKAIARMFKDQHELEGLILDLFEPAAIERVLAIQDDWVICKRGHFKHERNSHIPNDYYTTPSCLSPHV